MADNTAKTGKKAENSPALLSIKNVKKYFNVGRGQILKAIDNVSFDVLPGETLGLVGESGCGKSTLGRTLVRIYEPTEGSITYSGKDISKMSKRERFVYTKKMQMIFQDPYASLNPRMTVGSIIGEGIDIHGLYKGEERSKRIYELLELVGLNREHANRFPHEFSGGQRQRIGIARALAIEPEFIICDEPISALDVSVQAQIVNLLRRLQKKLGLTYIFIAHDLNMVKYISDRVAVMYLGTIVELADSHSIYERPYHPYTQALLSAIPIPDPEIERSRGRIILEGDVPSPINSPKGCPFVTRCPKAMDICQTSRPQLQEIEEGHQVACHLYNDTKERVII